MGVTEDERRRVSSAELLDIREESWRTRLSGVSLVAEVLVQPEHGEQALRALGRTLARYSDGYMRTRMIRRWPAVHVMSTVSVTTEFAKPRTVWPCIEERIGTGGQPFQKLWGEAFLTNLRKLGLPDFADFDEPLLRYMGPIQMHSGVPTYCLRDYLLLVAGRRASQGNTSPAELVAWASSQASAGRLYNVDKPVERFIRHGGDFAVDVTDRVFELLDVVASGGNVESVPLPDRFKEAARALARQSALPRAQRSTSTDVTGSTSPRLVLDPFGRGPVVRLPSLASNAGDQVTWQVVAGEREERLVSQSLWPGDPPPEVDFSLIVPVRAVSTSLMGHESLVHALPVVNDKDPLLVFGEDGEQRSTDMPLRGSLLWFLFLGAPDDLITEGTHSVQAVGTLPPGWAGWTLLLMDVAKATSVKLGQSQVRHRIRSLASVRILAGDPIIGLTSRSGGPVFSKVPQIVLPHGQDDSAAWTITITRDGHETLIDRAALSAGSDPRAIWDSLPRPLLGRFKIQVRGPWGRGGTAELYLAEGLRLASTPAWRRVDGRGLVPAQVTLTGPEALHIEDPILSFDATQTAKATTIRCRSTLDVLACPPHMAMSYHSNTRATAPSIRAVPLTTEELKADAGSLTVDLQSDGEPELHALAGTQLVQVVPPSGPSRAGRYAFDLRRLSETVQRHPHLRLTLDPTGEVAVATVTPQRLYSEIEHLSDTLMLHGSPDVEGLEALIYLAHAPWRPATQLPVSMGIVRLPEELANAGPLSVHVRIQDPWAPTPVPVRPPRGTTWVDGSGWLISDDEDETDLSRFLAGAGKFPEGSPDLSWLWAVLDRLPLLPLEDRFREVDIGTSRELSEHPTQALLALGSASVLPERVPEMLIRAGLPWLPTELAARARVDWTPTTAIAAALLTAPRLALAAGDPQADGYDGARLVCGDIIDCLLAGKDPAAAQGRLDVSAQIYLNAEPDTRAEFKRQVNLVPKGLLDGDSRTKAAFELLDNANYAKDALRHGAEQALREVRALLGALKDKEGSAAVAVRQHPEQTRSIWAYSALSIGFAWVARRAARGCARSHTWVSRNSRLWKQLARIAPNLVTIDLIRAEFLLAARDASQRIQPNPEKHD